MTPRKLRDSVRLRVIEGGPVKDDFREEIVRELASFRLQPAQCSGSRFDDLVHWLEKYERNPWTPEAVAEARHNPVFKADFADYFGRRRPRLYWALMARMIAHLLRDLLREAGQPRLTFGSSTGPMIRFVCRRLDRILPERLRPKHDAVFRMLTKSEARQVKPVRPRRKKRRKP
jgi:hypothetical protein